ncbi:MAG: SRPBCC family protein [Mycobacterium sp.]
MAHVSRSRTISARPQAIWDVLADFGAISSWASGADHSCLLHSGPDGVAVGTTRRVQAGRNALVERITEFDPPIALAYTVEGLPRRLGALANRWTLRPSGDRTAVTVTSTANGSGPLAVAVGWMVSRVMAKQSGAMLAGLAHRLEDLR